MASEWISYNELAWTEDFLANPADYEEEVNEYIKIIKKTEKIPVKTILHLGSGAGGYDIHFKKHFKIKGVDISVGMLEKARNINPEIEYIEGDMRDIRLNSQIDCVIIPDSIDYMATIDDFKKAIETASIHLKPGGVLLIVGKTKETFQNNNFAYSGQKDDTYITLFENNYLNPYKPDTYQITLVYLIRKKGILTRYFEETTGGLFSKLVWEDVLQKSGFDMESCILNGIYDKFLLDNGEYPLTVFYGRKKS